MTLRLSHRGRRLDRPPARCPAFHPARRTFSVNFRPWSPASSGTGPHEGRDRYRTKRDDHCAAPTLGRAVRCDRFGSTREDERAVAKIVGGFQDPSSEVLAEAAAAFGLLASAARLHIMWALSQGESDVTHLADRVGGALPAVSQHLAKLKLAGLVRSRREGRRQVYYVDDPDIVTVVRVMVGQLTARETSSAPSDRLREAGV